MSAHSFTPSPPWTRLPGLLTAGALLLGSAASGSAEPIVDKLEHAQIDWTAGVVLATGSGAPNLELPNVAAVRLAAERAAKLDAYRHVLEALEGVRVTVDETGRERMRRPEIRAQVEGIVRGCKAQDTRYYSDGGVDVVLRCPFEGGLTTALSPEGARTPVPSTEGSSAHTGLIIDASGVSAAPVLAPTVVKPDGTPIYEPRMVSAEALRLRGATLYVDSLQDAKAHPRVGKNPLVLNVVSTHPKKGWLLSAEDARKLEDVDLAFLKEGRVVVVLNPRRGR